MSPERWRQIKDAFDAVVGVPPAERSSVLERVCAGDAELRAEVERLLGEHDKARARNFLNPVIRTTSLVEGDIVANRYLIIALIGGGGMGEVYRAEDRLLREAVALKTLRAGLAGDEVLVRRFQKEIELARKVTHTNVCRIFEVGIHHFEEAGRLPLLFFTMELLTGETLSARIRRKGAASRHEAFRIGIQIAEGLQAAHEVGIVHADLKSGNIILVASGSGHRAVITDFGLAQHVGVLAASGETQTIPDAGVRAGTTAYMSPEQLTGEGITTASDIYSFGIVFFEMASGQLPFDDQDLIRSAMQRASGEGRSVRSLVPKIDSRWEAAIDRCLKRAPEARFGSAGDLASFLRGNPWIPANWTRREWIRASVTAGITLAFATLLLLWFHRPYHPPSAALRWYHSGVDALHSMTYETARRRFTQAVAADPSFALAYASLARAYDELDYSDLAKEWMLRAVALAQQTRLSDEDDRKFHALEFMVSRDYKDAAPLMQQMEKAASPQERPAAALESGWLAQLQDDTAGAEAAFERAVKMDPQYAAGKLRLGYILGRRGGKDDLALQAFSEAESLYNASGGYEGVAETLIQRANLLNRRSRSAEAVPVLERALIVARAVGNRYQEIEAQGYMGVAARNLGDNQQAARLAQEAIDAALAERMDNLAVSGMFDLGNAYLVRGDPASAEPFYRRAVSLAERGGVGRLKARAQFSLGSLAEQTHRPEEAKQFIAAALTFFEPAGYSREVIQLNGLLGSTLYQLGDYENGVRVLEEALTRAVPLHDTRLEALLRERLGDNLRGKGDWPSALTEYERAGKLYGSSITAQRQQLLCARLYSLLGRREDSKRSLSEVQEFLRKAGPNQGLEYQLRATHAEMEYADGHFGQALALAGQALPALARDEETEQELRLIRGWVLIRNGRISQGSDLATSVIAAMEKSKLMGDAAYARLSTAEALLAAGAVIPASQWAMDSLAFFEPRQIWEPVVRGHLLAARASRRSAEGNTHILSARVAFEELKKFWPATSLEGYRNRPDFQRLCQGIVL
jgi:eukaryotic-like serine/threonine-protein kinase